MTLNVYSYNLEFYLLVQTTDSCCTLLRTYFSIDTLLYLPTSNNWSYHFKIVEMHIGKLPTHFLRNKSCYDIHISFNFDLLVLSMCSSKHLYVFVFFFSLAENTNITNFYCLLSRSFFH